MRTSPCVVGAAMAPELLGLACRLEEAIRKGTLKRDAGLENVAKRFLKKLNSSGRLIGRRMKIIKLIARGGRGPSELMKEVPVRRRTFYRDLNAIEEAGFTLTLEDGVYHIS
jgi:hypothetical protein